MTRLPASLVVLFSASLALAACANSTSSIHGSRHTLYTGVTELAADSEAVVDVIVESQEIVQEDTPYTLSTVTIITPLQPKGLAANQLGPATVAPTERLVIRQLGSSEEEEVSAPLLEVGGRYLLFITSTKMEGDAASQFYITDVSAGIYSTENSSNARGGEVSYVQVDADSGDTLPSTLTATELTG
ncbi:hypothetical protein ACIQTX_15270 [Microbacterium sp. NPDC090281]|uniref:hypothetical protein n=1 Tax=Microbacterium sp. NPDC090281 TaxID=3364208 RepID=UPI00380EF271